MKSNCCYAPISTENDGGTTSWMVCEKCKKSCDLKCTCEEFHCNECGPKLLKKDDQWKEFEEKFGEMLNHLEVCLGVSERENLRFFILTKIEKAYENKMNKLKKMSFPIGERPWCIECLDRISKA